jgi:transposase
MKERRQPYPSDLNDAQWDNVKDVVPVPKPGGRPAKYSRREIVNVLLYVRRTGCQWRSLPHDLPHWNAVYWYFMLWRRSKTLDRIDDRLRTAVSRAADPVVRPAVVFDSRSVVPDDGSPNHAPLCPRARDLGPQGSRRL